MTVRVNECGKIRCPDGWSLTPERTTQWNDLDAWYLVGGNGSVSSHEGVHSIRPGTLLLMRGGSPYEFRRESETPFVHYWAHFDLMGDDRQPFAPQTAPIGGLHRQMPDPGIVRVLWDRLLEFSIGKSCDAGTAAVWMAAILAEVRRADHLSRIGGASSDPEISAICADIDENPDLEISVSMLADRRGLSRSQFYRRFRAQTGMSPKMYVVEARMRLARILLRESDAPIGVIALHVGYDDAQFFSRQFRLHNDCSPREYRHSGECDREQ